jgi:hypothetical protein
VVEHQIIGLDDIHGHFFHFVENILKVVVFIGKVVVQISLELVIGDFVGRLIFLVIFAIFLYGIVGEMNILICEIVKVKLFAAGSDIPFLVPIALEDAVDAGQEHIVPDVEFAIVV